MRILIAPDSFKESLYSVLILSSFFRLRLASTRSRIESGTSTLDVLSKTYTG